MGYLGKKEYEQAARSFFEQNKSSCEIYEGIFNNSRGNQSGQVQYILRQDGKQLIINKESGQIIDFYNGTSLDAFINVDIAGTITMTGLANMIINGIVALAGSRVIIALFLTMLCCIVLGMGVPTTANYCIMAATCAPILTRMGVPVVAAHFFVFYFGIVADLTPPVALAAYAGAAIAQANPMKTALTATKLAIAAFIVPYVFALNTAMLFIDTNALEVILICLTSFVGIFAVSAGLEGYLLHDMPWYQRILSLIGGLLLIYPGLTTDLVGLGLAGAVIILQLLTAKKKTAA